MIENQNPPSVNGLFEAGFKKFWNYPALTNYKGYTLYYRDVARRIEKIHIVFEQCGLNKGDKVAICARNQANWAVSFLAVLTYGAVAVPILHEFKPGSIHHLVNHSDSRILFVGDSIWDLLSESEMPNLKAIISLKEFALLYYDQDSILECRENLNEKFKEKYPKDFGPESVHFYQDSPDELALINYTSGTTGFSKGVMLSYRNLYANLLFAREVMPNICDGAKVVSILPSAHMYGLMFELLHEMTTGCHVHFLSRLPTPKIIAEAFAMVKPEVIIAVPMIIEKIYKKQLQPFLNKRSIRFLLRIPVIDNHIQRQILQELKKVFGGNFTQIIIGGAAFNKEAEVFFKRIGFPITVGYGLTECAPIVSYAFWKEHKLYSCGKVVARMEIKIDSPHPDTEPGEIYLRGENVMMGYYKNEEATRAVFTEDGWFRTGDMGILDKEGNLFIRGRCKNLILGPSGQNVYPEEIEGSINNMKYVVESLVVEEEDGSLVALVYPDYKQAADDGLSENDLEQAMEQMRESVNQDLPKYCHITKVKLYPEEFEKTPKRSIKRFLYHG